MVKKEHPSISMGTVYRNLNQLVQVGSIAKVDVPGGPVRFDAKTQPHFHMICGECGKVVDIPHEYLLGFDEKLEKDFSVEGFSLVFYGKCMECSKNESNRVARQR